MANLGAAWDMGTVDVKVTAVNTVVDNSVYITSTVAQAIYMVSAFSAL